jgi:hypothetical protein
VDHCSHIWLIIQQKDMREPYDWDAYAETFFPQAEKLVQRAEEAENAGEKEKASELYLYELRPSSPQSLC